MEAHERPTKYFVALPMALGTLAVVTGLGEFDGALCVVRRIVSCGFRRSVDKRIPRLDMAPDLVREAD